MPSYLKVPKLKEKIQKELTLLKVKTVTQDQDNIVAGARKNLHLL